MNVKKEHLRAIAIYLPQFHPIKENDEWWGKGFTEWRNVVKSRPRFSGHYQPQLPSDLGYYDLRVPEVRQAQADLAKEYGIHGFCYYHYWFNGRRILERPFNDVIESGKPDFPFMLCWANENWTRIWDGGDKNVLLEQNYSEEDDKEHAKLLVSYFKDPRYIKVDGRPVFIIYKDAVIPDVKRTAAVLREECKKNGLDLYLCRFERDVGTSEAPGAAEIFDADIEFQPLSKAFNSYKQGIKKYRNWYRYKKRINALLNMTEPDRVFSYPDVVQHDLQKSQYSQERKIYPGVSPSWDNSSRRPDGRALIFKNSTPEVFGNWVKGKIRKFKPYSAQENFIFINAWNEWAEGNHMEPCTKWGHQYLQAFSDAMGSSAADRDD